MPVLKNMRRERFCRAIVEGMSGKDAWLAAGYTPADPESAEQLASRSRNVKEISSRIMELQAQQAKRHNVTLDTITNELEQARTRAMEVDQLGAAVTATATKAKLHGLQIDKSEIRTIQGAESAQSLEELAKIELKALGINEPSQDQITMAIQEQRRHAQTMLAIKQAPDSPKD